MVVDGREGESHNDDYFINLRCLYVVGVGRWMQNLNGLDLNSFEMKLCHGLKAYTQCGNRKKARLKKKKKCTHQHSNE
jgi:hypothetical protein